MGPAIATVKANATSIMTAVRTAQPDSDFGVANYTDFDCSDPFPFHLDQAVTGDPGRADGDRRLDGRERLRRPRGAINALYTLATDPAVGFEPIRRGSSSGSATHPATTRAAVTRSQMRSTLSSRPTSR